MDDLARFLSEAAEASDDAYEAEFLEGLVDKMYEVGEPAVAAARLVVARYAGRPGYREEWAD